MVGILLVFTGSIGIKIGRAWGGSWFARVGGYSVAFVLMLGAQVAAGLILGWLFASVMARWPNNPIAKLIRWANARR